MISSIRLVLLCLMLSSVALLAQAPGSLRGQVLDPSGAVVPKASVTATGPNGVVKVVQTGNDGTFTIMGLPPGKYTVRILATGFTLIEKTDVDVPSGRALTMDAKLSVASETQEVTVADSQQVQLDPANNAGALVLKEADLDMLSDDPDDLQADLLALAGPAAGPNGGQIFIDGFSNGQLPPKESIREIRINSNPFSTEYDTPGRGRIEILTKPGSDKFHGALNVQYSDWLFNARNPFGANKPFSDTKNLQSNFSGPLSKKKASFFLEFSRRQQREAVLINAVILDPTTFLPVQQAYGLLAPNTRTSFSPRIDYQLTTNITLQGRYNWNRSEVDNNGVGGTNLPSTAATNKATNQNIQLTETWVVKPTTINETRFQYSRNRSNSVGIDPELNISVAGAFTSGSNFPLQYSNNDSYELQNYTSITHGAQFLKFGTRLRGYDNNSYSTNNFPGQFNFTSITAYQIMQQGIAQHLGLPQIIANGGGPNQYTVAAGQPLVGVNQVDAAFFFQDDWKVKPSITLSMGMRYEIQDNIGDRGDWAPRIGLAWGIGGGQGRLRQPKTVVRAGAGYFYDRFSVNNVLNAERFNGVNQLTSTVSDPQFFPAAGVPIPPLNQLPTVASATYHIDSSLRAPTLLQSAIGIDRQLPKNITLSVNYISSRGFHQLRTVNINTPFPGTYFGPGTGLYPYGTGAGILDLYETSGDYKQNQLIFNTNARINARFSLFGFYMYGHAHTDVIGQPSNPYNFAADYGRASYDSHHRANINGSLLLPLGLRMSPNITFNSAPPFNITQGVDQYGDTLFNSRPALAPAGFVAPVCSARLAATLATCLVSTAKYGTFVVNPPAGLKVIPINNYSGYSQFNFNVRLSRTWGFGEKITSPTNRPQGGGRGGPGGGPGGFGGGGPRGGGGRGPGGGGPGMFGGGNTSNNKYTLTAGLFVNNLLNHLNPGSPVGNLLDPRFGESLALNSIGGQGAAQAFNRRVEISLRFSF
jgi:hypothetical protein